MVSTSSGKISVFAPDVVIIGGSAGGLKALQDLLTAHGPLGDSVLIAVLHRPPTGSPLAEVLEAHNDIPIHEPANSPWECPVGALTVAPAGYHMLLGNSRTPLRIAEAPLVVAPYQNGCGVRAHLTLDPPVLHSRPSIDVTFTSAAQLVNSLTAVLLSCANADGAQGCASIKAAGGTVVLQDPATCEASTAVNAALRIVDPDYVADPAGIGRWLSTMAAG